ncbi:MAG: hypothetical protein IJ944_05080 [Clostridia bacterium]|nr:hypothetical protein [Clostridia bacterium]
MNKGGLPILGVGVFIFIAGYLSEEKLLMFIAAFVLLAGFGLLAAKSNNKNPETGQEYFKCPNCDAYAGEEIPEEKRKDEKTYKCKICNYRW